MALVHSTGMFLSELQESIHHLSNHIISLLSPSSLSPSSEEFETTTHQCDRCAINNKQLTKICSTIQCPSMRVCPQCLFQLFEANGYHNTCPLCHQYLKFEKYQEACDSPVSIPLNEVKSTLESLIDQICCDDESSYPSNPPHERTFENVLNEWESCFNLSCDCGETHYLYPSESHGSIISGLDFQSLMKMVKRVCGPSEERQFLFLQILQKFISGEKSSSEFIENCESYFLTHSEYSKVGPEDPSCHSYLHRDLI